MRTAGKKVAKFNGSLYALIPFYVAEPYEIDKGTDIEIDTSHRNVLILKIKKERIK